MQITLDKKTQTTLFDITNDMNISIQTFIQNAIKEQIEKIEQKKKNEVLDNIASSYKELQEAKKSGTKLQSFDELLDEL